jgi:transposase-like protein
MAKMKLTDKQIGELRAAYEAWNPHDPNSESATELAKRFGISKQTLYTLRKRWFEEDRRLRDKAAAVGSAGQSDEASKAALEEVIRFLTGELVQAKVRIEQLERLLAGAGVIDPSNDGNQPSTLVTFENGT